MYEEIDERYQEKRIRMLQVQNMQIEEQFHRHLLAAFAARANPNGSVSSIASRRASMTPRASVDGGSSRKMSLDLSNLRSPYPNGLDTSSLTSPMATSDGYAMSPSTNYDPNAQSYMSCLDGSDGSAYSNMVASAATTAASSTQIPAYVAQSSQVPMTAWPSHMQWTPMPQQVPTPNQTPTDSQAVHMWQQQMMQQAQMSDSTTQMRQFRDRLASAPELPVHPSAASQTPAASISGPSTGHSGLGHTRGSSHPTNNFHNLQLLTQGTHLAQMGPSNTSSPKIEALSAETQSTPDFCPTPNTPLSPTAIGMMPATMAPTKEGEPVMVSHEELDPDYNEFSQFALGLGNSSMSEREPFGFDDFVALDEFGTVTC